ncbi:MAG: phosphogluconate dehydratase, partial [Gaiellales bacterium]|nr:phosphogluconate dehydratase [Gaiellales bacterium]
MSTTRTDRHAQIHPTVAAVTARIAERSSPTRAAYLQRTAAAHAEGPVRRGLACSNLAHGFAAFEGADREALRAMRMPGVAIISSYNDMLS